MRGNGRRRGPLPAQRKRADAKKEQHGRTRKKSQKYLQLKSQEEDRRRKSATFKPPSSADFQNAADSVGVSAGIKGLRLGTGPRGNYVYMGRGGLYFRKSLNPPGGRAATRSDTPQLLPRPGEPSGPGIPLGTVGPLHDVESGSVEHMVDASSAELLREMNEKRKKVRLLPGAIALTVIGKVLLLAGGMPTGQRQS
jgi:hypothetical protein